LCRMLVRVLHAPLVTPRPNEIAAMAIDPDLRALLLKTIQLQQKGAHVAGPRALTLDKKYNAQYILKIARNVSLPEITVLIRASEIREKGLAAVKAGDTTNGGALLREARRIFSEAALSKEALVSADSFQYPAEAYLQYRRGEYDQAEASVLQAIMLCHVLRDEYEHQVESGESIWPGTSSG